MTSDIYPFEIFHSTFHYNSASNNALSFKQSYGTIYNTTFFENHASYYSGNLFLSFSEVDLVEVDFSDILPEDPYTVLDESEIQGQFIFISLGVELTVQHCNFYNGISR
mmetsp:Transcript_9697/g.9401  ORF Transcript_9697/g.9401 Transcript_9697/m.9401 type:complete len:109 (+) Transcript_9697:185-511(+)